jgi:hypothetical protein
MTTRILPTTPPACSAAFKIATAAALGLLLASGCSMQYTGNSAGADRQVYANVDEDGEDLGLECRREPVLGTRMTKKVCSTREQREARTEASRAGFEDTVRRANFPSSTQ